MPALIWFSTLVNFSVTLQLPLFHIFISVFRYWQNKCFLFAVYYLRKRSLDFNGHKNTSFCLPPVGDIINQELNYCPLSIIRFVLRSLFIPALHCWGLKQVRTQSREACGLNVAQGQPEETILRAWRYEVFHSLPSLSHSKIYWSCSLRILPDPQLYLLAFSHSTLL